MTDLSPEARALLDAARDGDSPTAADRARVRRALAVAIATGTTSVSASAASKAALGGSSVLAKGSVGWWLVVGAAAGVATSAAVFAGWPAHDPAPAHDAVKAAETTTRVVTHSPAANVVREDDAPVTAEPAHPGVSATTHDAPGATHKPKSSTAMAAPPGPVSTAVVVVSAEATPAPPNDAPSTLGAETSLLQAARAALGRGDAQGALALLDRHEHDFPRGVLVEERLATRVFALCAMGRTAEATPVAARMLSLFPASPLRGRVLASCAATR